MRRLLVLTLALTVAFFVKAFDREAIEAIDFEKCVTIKIAEKAELQMAALTLGTISGNPLVGGFLASQINSFDPNKEGVEIDPTLKNGEVLRCSLNSELFDKVFEACGDKGTPYVGLIKGAVGTYSVTKSGIELKCLVDLSEKGVAKISDEKSFTPALLETLAEDTLAFVICAQGEIKAITRDVKKDFESIKMLVDKQDQSEWEKKGEEWGKMVEAECKGKSLTLAYKGFKPEKKITERFAATFPEYKDTELKSASFFSLYSQVKTLAPVAISLLDDPDQKTMATMFLMQLPEEGVGGIGAVAMVSKEGKLVVHCRISADEVKAISGAANAVIMMAMMNGGFNNVNAPEVDEPYEDLIDDEDLDLED